MIKCIESLPGIKEIEIDDEGRVKNIKGQSKAKDWR